MMWSAASRRRRNLAGLGLILAAVWLAAGLRQVEDDGAAVVLDSPLGIVVPRAVAPGWHVAPPGLARLTRYPIRSATLNIPAGGDAALVTREGSAVDAGLVLRYHVDPARVLEVHRDLGAGYESAALARWAREALAAAIASARYADISGARVEALRDEVGRALAERLRGAGFVLLACEIPVVRLRAPTGAADGAGRGAARPSGPILIVGLDGADWNIVDPLLTRGRMPRLGRLIRGGVRGRVRTIEPVLSPVLWTSIATGMVPGRHGILDFVATTGRDGERVPVTSAQRRVKAFWNMLGESGIRVGVAGWWATWPAEPVDGFIISDRVAYQLAGARPLEERDRRGKVHPPDADALVVAAAVAPESILPGDLSPFLRLPAGEADLPPAQARLVEDFKTILASGRTYVAATLALAARGRPDVTAVYLEGTDTVGHLFMPFAPPPLAGVDPEGRRRFGGAVDAYYAHADDLIGRLEDGLRPETVIVVSDHGFRTGDNRPLTESRIGYGAAADWHRKYGIIVLNGPAFRKGAAIDEASVLDITPTLLRLCGLPVGEDMDGRPIEAAFDPAWNAANPERYIASWEGAPGGVERRAGNGPEAGTAEGPRPPDPAGGAAATGTAAASPDAGGDADRLRRLRELGYLAGAGETANAHNNRGTELLAAGRYDEAIAEFETAIRAGEDSGIARLNLARARYKKRDYAGAVAAIDEYTRARPRSKEAATLLGTMALEQGREEEAAGHFRRALEHEPNFADARNGLGLVFERQGRRDAALAEFRRVVAIDPDYAEAHNNIGIILKSRGAIDEAAASFRRAIAADPEFAGSYSNLAVIQEERGDYAEAERHFREALRHAPGDAQVRTNLGGLLYLRGRLAEAEIELRRAIADDPRHAAAYNNLAAVLGRLGKAGEEIAAHRRAVELDPGAADLRHNLALALIRGGRSEAGVAELRRAAAIDPSYRPAYLNLGRHLLESGAIAEALALLREGAGRLPGDGEIAALRGEAALRAGEADEAVRAFESALRLRPGDPDVARRLDAARAAAASAPPPGGGIRR